MLLTDAALSLAALPVRAMRAYLDWETGLLQTIEADGPLRYRNLLWPHAKGHDR